jgi:hypothetical protein
MDWLHTKLAHNASQKSGALSYLHFGVGGDAALEGPDAHVEIPEPEDQITYY